MHTVPVKRSKNPALPLGSLAAALGASQSASAAIVYFNPGTVTAAPGDSVYVDITGGISSNSTIPEFNFQLTDYVSKPPFGFPKPAKPEVFSNSGSDLTVLNGSYVAKLSSGAEITSGFSGGQDAYMASDSLGPWASPNDGTGYVGFSIEPASTVLYGWMQVDYDSTSGNLSVIDWAYDDSGASIRAGETSVPEPAEAALLASLLAGSAVLFARRRRQAI